MHGVTHATGQVTLLGALPRGSGSLTFGHKASTLEREYLLSAVVFQAHVNDDTRFSAISFEANNVAEFFHPQGFKLNDEFTKSPVLEGDRANPEIAAQKSCPGLTVSVERGYVASFVPQDPASAFLLDKDDEAHLIKDLNEAIRSIMRRHRKELLLQKREIQYRTSVEAADLSGAVLTELRYAAFQVCSLFSLFCLKPVLPTRLWVQRAGNSSPQQASTCQILVPILYSRKQLRSLRKDRDRYSLPVTSDAIRDNYNHVLRTWFGFIRTDLNLVYTCFARHLIGDFDAHQEYVLLVAAIEQCSVLAGIRGKQRYDWFVEEYAPSRIKDEFLRYLPAGTARAAIGDALGTVRNCIVHPRKVNEPAFRKYRDSTETIAIHNLSELIFLSLVNYLYRRIGLPNEVVEGFEENIQQYLVTVH